MGEVRLGPEDDGRTVGMRPGDRLVITLPETASSGYRWMVDQLPSGAQLLEERYESATGGPIGSPSRHVFVLQAAAPGPLRLRHARSTQDGADVVDRFEVALVPATG